MMSITVDPNHPMKCSRIRHHQIIYMPMDKADRINPIQNQSNPESIQRKRFVQQQMPGGMYKTQQDGSPRISSTENQTETMNGESSTPQQGQLSLNNALSNSSSASSHSVSDI
eukprot:319081_1